MFSPRRAKMRRAAVAALTSEGHEGKTYKLAGDEAYTLRNLALEISRQTRKTIPYKDISWSGLRPCPDRLWSGATSGRSPNLFQNAVGRPNG
jgi:hypothetical protein